MMLGMPVSACEDITLLEEAVQPALQHWGSLPT